MASAAVAVHPWLGHGELVAHLRVDVTVAPGVLRVLAAWSLDPQITVPVFVAAWLYLAGVRQVRRTYPAAPWPRSRTWWFLAGLALIEVALQSPIDAYADVFLWIHMIQHLILAFLAPPLLLLGMPVTLALRASASRARRRVVLRIVHSGPVRVLTHPLVAWALFAGVMVGTHFSPLYEAALEHVWVHDLEHALYLASGLLFWWPMVGLDPSPWRMPHPLRLLYLFVAGPVNTFTALAIYSATDLLYPFYATVQRSWGPTPLQDQQWAGALMWIIGDLILLVSVVFAAAAWMRHDQAEAVRLDRRLDAERDRAPPRSG